MEQILNDLIELAEELERPTFMPSEFSGNSGEEMRSWNNAQAQAAKQVRRVIRKYEKVNMEFKVL